TSSDDGLFECPLSYVAGMSEPCVKSGILNRLAQVPDELGVTAVSLERKMAAIVHQEEVLLVPLNSTSNSVSWSMPVEIHYERLALHPTGAWLAAAGREPHSIDLWSVSRRDDVLSPTTIPGSEYFTFSP